MKILLDIFLAALKLGLTSFGGPVAHLGYFHREYVLRRRWLGEDEFADLVALCQALPGPASSQLGMAVGSLRGGAWGAFAAWLGFTLPSALLMGLLGFWWTHGLELFDGLPLLVRGASLLAFVIVGFALWSMGRRLLRAPYQVAVAAVTVGVSALWPGSWTTLAALVAAALAGLMFEHGMPQAGAAASPRRAWALVCLGMFFLLLAVLPWLAAAFPHPLLLLADGFYRTGALVFGGGHVVLPLLQNELVVTGRVTPDAFLVGYGFGQAVPGPLFTLSSYLGCIVGGPWGAAVAVAAVFLPSFLLIVGVLPFWHGLKGNRWFRRGLAGVNAAVVGLLAWALYDPLLLSVIG